MTRRGVKTRVKTYPDDYQASITDLRRDALAALPVGGGQQRLLSPLTHTSTIPHLIFRNSSGSYGALFLTDENISPGVVAVLRRTGLDVQDAKEQGWQGSSDQAILLPALIINRANPRV
jgi:hypothetical protein